MKQDWNTFWSKIDGNKTYLSKFLSFYRIQIVARSVDYYINKYFKTEGIFIECGAGTSETTLKTIKKNRKFVALDYSMLILETTTTNPKIDTCINADIFSLPFKDNSVDGIWNVGVMEHFTIDNIYKILKEFRRVLKRGGHIILFWPMVYSPYQFFIKFVEFSLNLFSKKIFQLYPDEVSKLRSRMQGRTILNKSKFKEGKIYFNFRDAFSFGVLVGKK